MPTFNLPATQRIYLPALLAALLCFRLWLAAQLPLTGDEAYFVLWGRNPDWGFYDHPPMVGWWISGLLAFSDSPLWLRLPSVLLPFALAFAAFKILSGWDQQRALLAALFVLLAPANVWNVLITTDTPLVFFGVLSTLVFIRAFQTERLTVYLLCGALFAGAVLSKYFAAILGISFAVATLLAPTRIRIIGLFIIGFLMLPALALMGWWNAENCWPNILFNLVSRNTRATFHWQQPVTYLLMMTYMLGFLPLWFGLNLKSPSAFMPWRGTADDRLFWALAWVPFILFAVLSLSKQIGLHWVLTFIPIILCGLLRNMGLQEAWKSVKWLLAFGILHTVALIGLAVLPIDYWKNNSRYTEIIWTTQTSELVQAAGMNTGDRYWFTDGYTYAAELSYAKDREFGRTHVYGGDHVGVFGVGSHYARQDDRLTDFSTLDGKNFGLVLRSRPETKDYAPYFARFQVEPFTLHGAIFYRILGDGFNYAAYRENILKPVRERFYRFPAWLPDCGCFFDKRYFPESN